MSLRNQQKCTWAERGRAGDPSRSSLGRLVSSTGPRLLKNSWCDISPSPSCSCWKLNRSINYSYAPVDQHGYAKPAICWESSKQNPWDSMSKHMNLPESTRGAHFQKVTPWHAPLRSSSHISLCWVATPPTSGQVGSTNVTNGPWIAHASSASIIMSSTHGCFWSPVEARLSDLAALKSLTIWHRVSRLTKKISYPWSYSTMILTRLCQTTSNPL